jgi:hypothetical protein
MPAHPDTDKWLAELNDSKVHWADKINQGTIERVASTGDLRAVKSLAAFLYVLALNGYQQPPEAFIQMMRGFVKSGEAREAAEAVLFVLFLYRDKEPGDPEEVGNLRDYRNWLAEAFMVLGDASVEPLMRELSNFHRNTTTYITYALAQIKKGHFNR